MPVSIDRNEAVVLSNESQWRSVCMLPIGMKVLLIQKQQALAHCQCSYCRMSLQKQYTLCCERVYFLFGIYGVSAPVGVNREWRTLVCRLVEVHPFGMQ